MYSSIGFHVGSFSTKAPPPRSLCAACTRSPSSLRRPLPCYARSSGVLWGVEGPTDHPPVLDLHVGVPVGWFQPCSEIQFFTGGFC